MGVNVEIPQGRQDGRMEGAGFKLGPYSGSMEAEPINRY